MPNIALGPDSTLVRLDTGTCHRKTKPGSGLGLSIVMDLAQSYRGSCELARAPKGGLAVHLELPAA